MDQDVKVAIIGDYDPHMRHHLATDEALVHAAAALSLSLTSSWIPTHLLVNASADTMLMSFDALWCAPGSPYQSMHGAIEAIRFAREQGWPFIGT